MMSIECVISHLDAALLHVSKRARQKGERDDIWDLRVNWALRKRQLSDALRTERYVFSPCLAVAYRPGHYLHAYRTQDRLLLKAMALALNAQLPRSPLCFSYRGHGGVAGAQRFIRALPAMQFGFKTDVADYYASIDAARVVLKLAPYVQDERFSRLIYRALQRSDGINGLPRGSALSHTLGNFYLHDLDTLFEGRPTQHYCRYMDDILVLTEHRGALRRGYRAILNYFARNTLLAANHKSFIGRARTQWRGGLFLGWEMEIGGA